MNNCVWMEITQDKYQLPVAVADSAVELARIRGTTSDSVRANIYHYKRGIIKTQKYIKVEVEEDD